MFQNEHSFPIDVTNTFTLTARTVHKVEFKHIIEAAHLKMAKNKKKINLAILCGKNVCIENHQ